MEDHWEYALKIIKTTNDYQISEVSHPDCLVGTDHPQPDPGILLYPNPAKGIVNIVSQVPIKEFRVYNSDAKLLLVGNPVGQEFNIEIGDIPGTYVVQFMTNGGWFTKKLIVVE